MSKFLKEALESKIRYDPPPEGANMARMLWDAFERHSDRVLLADVAGNRQFTGAELKQTIGLIATNLIRKLSATDRANQTAIILCDNSSEQKLTVLGLIIAGCAIYGSNSDEGIVEGKTLWTLVKPDLIVYEGKIHNEVVSLKKELNLSETRLICLDGHLSLESGILSRDGVISYKDLSDEKLSSVDPKLIEESIFERIRPEVHALTYLLTSGSTGRPKVVRSTHEEVMHSMYSMISASKYPLPGHDEDDYRSLLLPMNETSVFAGDLPMDHGAGINTLFLSINVGSKFVLMPSYDVDTFWQAVNDFKITSSIASTSFTYKLLLRLKELISLGENERYDLSSFRWICCTGSKMAFVDLAKEINCTYEQLNICQTYGATEFGFIAMLAPISCKTHLHSVGHLFPGVFAKIVDPDTGKLCQTNERGELHIWSTKKFKQYMCHPSDDPEQMMSRCHDEQGFYITGDQAHFDHEQRLYLHGRLKDTLFLEHDIKILPAELEDIINQHPLVEQSAVVGVPDKEVAGCDAPRAFIKLISAKGPDFDQVESEELREKLLNKELELIAKDVNDFYAERMAEQKHLKGGVRILDEFPTNGIMKKIDRKALKLIV